jgi:8-oxo-dGTP diphosphatase
MIRHFTASGIVLDGDGHVLLIHHRRRGWWVNPGGHIDPDEDPVQAVLREVAEETGITGQILAEPRFSHPAVTVLPPPFTICVQDIPGTGGAAPHQHIDMIYVLTPITRDITPQLTEVAGCEWVPLAKVADLGTPPELPAIIEAATRYARRLTS